MTRSSSTSRTADLDHVHGSPITLAAVAQLVAAIRPDWPPHLVTAVLHSHASQVHLGDLAVAAIRAAQNPAFRSPRTIGWRGPHWDGAKTVPLEVARPDRCDVCSKPEPRCLTERPGADDDHVFVARR
jgi:hypothetical protein